MAVVLSDQEKDATLTQFLSMMEDRVDPDVAKNLLEAVGWDVQAATEQLYGGPQTPARGVSMQAERDMLAGFEAEDVAMEVGPEGFPMPPRGGGGIGEDPDDLGMQSQMDAAIAASFAAQTGAGMAQTDDDLLAQALRMSQQDEDSRQRQQLREQQEAELAESELMDQMRERAEQEQLAQEAVVEQSRLEEERRQAAEFEAKRARVPDEPLAGEMGRMAIMFRLPDGKKVQRAFRSSDAVGSLYDFLDVHSGQEFAQRRYQLVSTMPRKEFGDRGQKLAEAGIQNQFVLMVELSKDD